MVVVVVAAAVIELLLLLLVVVVTVVVESDNRKKYTVRGTDLELEQTELLFSSSSVLGRHLHFWL
jgi:hypothetical protein